MAKNSGFKCFDEKDLERALIRARHSAWEDAKRWGTAFVTWENGKVVLKYPAEPGRPDEIIDPDKKK